MKIVRTDWENLHIFWMILETSMKFSGRMWLMIILKITKTVLQTHFKIFIFGKNHSRRGEGGGLISSRSRLLEDTFLLKHQSFQYLSFYLALFKIHHCLSQNRNYSSDTRGVFALIELFNPRSYIVHTFF